MNNPVTKFLDGLTEVITKRKVPSYRPGHWKRQVRHLLADSLNKAKGAKRERLL
jgi:hypothetical protein